MQLCPCGSNNAYANCCEIYISNKQAAPTPETLMRSRYTAFTLANVDYIKTTMEGEALKDFNAEASRLWAQHTKWLGLEVVQAPTVAADSNIGFVEFIAHYIFNNKKECIHEISEFHRKNNRWYYIDGKHTNEPTTSHAIKIGRNNLCPCGSNKKYKKCCGQ